MQTTLRVLLVLACASARADERTAIVFLTEGPTASEVETSIIGVLRTELADLGVGVTVAHAGGDDITRRAHRLLVEREPLSVCRYDSATRSIYFVYSGPDGAQALSRQLPDASRPGAIAESAGIAIRELVSALIADDAADATAGDTPDADDGDSRPPTEETPRPEALSSEAPTPLPPHWKRLRLGLETTLEVVSDKPVVQYGPAFEVGVAPHRHVVLVAGYNFFAPSNINWTSPLRDDEARGQLTLSRHCITAAIRAEVIFTRIGLSGSVGGQGCVVRYDSQSIWQVSSREIDYDRQFSLPIRLRPYFLATENVRPYISVGVDILLVPPKGYSEEEVYKYRPYLAQLFLSLGFSVAVL
jgi:hypothetical protein